MVKIIYAVTLKKFQYLNKTTSTIQYRSTHQLRFGQNGRSRKLIKFLNGFQGKFKKGDTHINKKDTHTQGKPDLIHDHHKKSDSDETKKKKYEHHQKHDTHGNKKDTHTLGKADLIHDHHKKSDSDETKKKKSEHHQKHDDSDRVSLMHRDPVATKSLTKQTIMYPKPIEYKLLKAKEKERLLREQKILLEQHIKELREQEEELQREVTLAKIEELEEQLREIEEAIKEEEITIEEEEENIRIQEEINRLAAIEEATTAAGVPLPAASSSSMEPAVGQLVDCEASACEIKCEEELPSDASKPCKCKEKCKNKFGRHIEDKEDFTTEPPSRVFAMTNLKADPSAQVDHVDIRQYVPKMPKTFLRDDKTKTDTKKTKPNKAPANPQKGITMVDKKNEIGSSVIIDAKKGPTSGRPTKKKHREGNALEVEPDTNSSKHKTKKRDHHRSDRSSSEDDSSTEDPSKNRQARQYDESQTYVFEKSVSTKTSMLTILSSNEEIMSPLEKFFRFKKVPRRRPVVIPNNKAAYHNSNASSSSTSTASEIINYNSPRTPPMKDTKQNQAAIKTSETTSMPEEYQPPDKIKRRKSLSAVKESLKKRSANIGTTSPNSGYTSIHRKGTRHIAIPSKRPAVVVPEGSKIPTDTTENSDKTIIEDTPKKQKKGEQEDTSLIVVHDSMDIGEAKSEAQIVEAIPPLVSSEKSKRYKPPPHTIKKYRDDESKKMKTETPEKKAISMVNEGKLDDRERAYRKALEQARKQRDVTPSRTKKYKEIEVNKRKMIREVQEKTQDSLKVSKSEALLSSNSNIAPAEAKTRDKIQEEIDKKSKQNEMYDTKSSEPVTGIKEKEPDYTFLKISKSEALLSANSGLSTYDEKQEESEPPPALTKKQEQTDGRTLKTTEKKKESNLKSSASYNSTLGGSGFNQERSPSKKHKEDEWTGERKKFVKDVEEKLNDLQISNTEPLLSESQLNNVDESTNPESQLSPSKKSQKGTEMKLNIELTNINSSSQDQIQTISEIKLEDETQLEQIPNKTNFKDITLIDETQQPTKEAIPNFDQTQIVSEIKPHEEIQMEKLTNQTTEDEKLTDKTQPPKSDIQKEIIPNPETDADVKKDGKEPEKPKSQEESLAEDLTNKLRDLIANKSDITSNSSLHVGFEHTAERKERNSKSPPKVKLQKEEKGKNKKAEKRERKVSPPPKNMKISDSSPKGGLKNTAETKREQQDPDNLKKVTIDIREKTALLPSGTTGPAKVEPPKAAETAASPRLNQKDPDSDGNAGLGNDDSNIASSTIQMNDGNDEQKKQVQEMKKLTPVLKSPSLSTGSSESKGPPKHVKFAETQTEEADFEPQTPSRQNKYDTLLNDEVGSKFLKTHFVKRRNYDDTALDTPTKTKQRKPEKNQSERIRHSRYRHSFLRIVTPPSTLNESIGNLGTDPSALMLKFLEHALKQCQGTHQTKTIEKPLPAQLTITKLYHKPSSSSSGFSEITSSENKPESSAEPLSLAPKYLRNFRNQRVPSFERIVVPRQFVPSCQRIIIPTATRERNTKANVCNIPKAVTASSQQTSAHCLHKYQVPLKILRDGGS